LETASEKGEHMISIHRESNQPLSGRASLLSRLSRASLTTVAAAGLLLTAVNARAACGSFVGPHAVAPVMPLLAQAEASGEDFRGAHADSIVGLWAVVYTAGGATFNETLDQWHSDGTEFENAYLAPEQGNICFGVWKAVGRRAVRLHHIGWTFDPTSNTNTANGTFTVDETNTVSADGKTYTGTFTFKTFDLKGNPGADVTGTIAATRITVD
jgi:hypothetical protein